MEITPMDIAHKEFNTALRGFNKEEVREFLAAVSSTIEEMLQERSRLLGEMESLKQNLERYHNIEDNMQSALMLAQKTSEETIAGAHQKSELIIEQAKHKAGLIEQDCSGIQARRDQFLLEFKALLETYRQHVAKLEGSGDGGAG